jgi:pantetheine-phosphate adenylyltransferase
MGHVTLVGQGLAVFDRLVVAVAKNPSKASLFTAEERISLLKESLRHFPSNRLEIDSFDGLTVEYARSKGASAILRGLRAASDFEYEFQLAMMNRHLNQDIQSVFMMADLKWFYISSSLVKEAFALGADIAGLVPRPVADRLAQKLCQGILPKSQG